MVREAGELDSSLRFHANDLNAVFNVLQREMYSTLQEHWRKTLSFALVFWKYANERTKLISPKPFNQIAKAAISAQASSDSAESLFNDLGGNKGSERQSLLSGMLDMTQVIRAYVISDIEAFHRPQHTLLHPQGATFCRAICEVTQRIANGWCTLGDLPQYLVIKIMNTRMTKSDWLLQNSMINDYKVGD